MAGSSMDDALIQHQLVLHYRVQQFLAWEALLLDEGRFEEWYALLDDNLVYGVPIRQATEDRADEYPAGSWLIKDTKPMIRVRIDRLKTGHAHAESPPSRTLRSVGSLCLLPSSSPGHIDATSSLVVYRQRGNERQADVFYARRNDRLICDAQELRLVRRTIQLIDTTLPAPNLSIFL
jgi:N,N-dimethyl phenylurea N-demethylase beta subunit